MDVVVLPGRNFGPNAPVTWFPTAVAERRGARIHRVEWPTGPPAPTDDGAVGWIADVVESVLADLPEPALLIGNSLGTLAAGVAADRGLPAVWLTPLLHLSEPAASIARATRPALLVGGTADPSWDGQLARELSEDVLEVPDADHLLVPPGTVRDAAAVHLGVVEAVEAFLDRLGWPSPVP